MQCVRPMCLFVLQSKRTECLDDEEQVNTICEIERREKSIGESKRNQVNIPRKDKMRIHS